MPRIYLFAILSGLALLILVLELVRRRRLREEYSWLWLLIAVGYFLVAVWPNLSVWVARLVGSANPTSAFTFLGLLFLFLLSIQFSVQISRLAEQNKDLAQQIAILDAEVRRLSGEARRIAGEEETEAGEDLAAEGPGQGPGLEKGQDAGEQEPDAQRIDD